MVMNNDATGNFGKSEQSQKKILELQAAPG